MGGKLPFGGSVADLMYQHQHTAPPIEKLRGVPAPVISLLQVLLEKDPSQRIQDPAQLREALTKVNRAIASNSLLTAKELRRGNDQAREQSLRRKPRRHSLRWLGAAIASLMFGALLLFSLREGLSSQRNVGTVATEESIAVLPFESLSEQKQIPQSLAIGESNRCVTQ